VKRFQRRVLAIIAGALLCGAQPAAAQYTRDRSANERINKAVADHYLQMNFGQAEEQLLGVVKACEDKCRPATIARAWMYVGVVRGSGKGDQHSAKQAFDTAVGQDPGVELDEALATPETKVTFEASRKSRPEGGRRLPMIGASPMGGGDEPLPSDEPLPDEKPKRKGLACTPTSREVQTRRAIPFDCRSDEEVARMTLRYQEHGEAEWKTIDMQRAGESFRATLPCEITTDSGRISFFVVASDATGDPVDTLGSKGEPQRITIDPKSTEAPAYPGAEPPPRCEEKVLCPPDFPGCEDLVSAGEALENEPEPTYKKNWFGAHFALDIGFIGGDDVCSTANTEFDCYASETPFPEPLPFDVADPDGELGDVYPGTGIGSGAAAGTMRALLSYDRAFTDKIMAGARLGFAFRGGPETADGRAFLPVHAEGRLSYWPLGLSTSSLRPYLHIGGGIAQVDVKVGNVTVQDCSEQAPREEFLDCIEAQDAYDSANEFELPEKTVDAYRKLGNGFVTTGGGVLFPLSESTAIQLNVNAMLMLPSTGFVLEPSVGVVYGM
jgi:hypothetical protein